MRTADDLDPRYGFTVAAWTLEDSGESQAEWDAAHHRYINIKSTLDPDLNHGFSPDEVFAANRWSAGVLARAARCLAGAIEFHNESHKHRCAKGFGLDVCGWAFDEGVTTGCDGPLWAARQQATPRVTLCVPRKYVEGWVEQARLLILDLLAEDTTPLAPTPTPGHDPSSVIIEAPASQPRRTEA